MKRLPSLDTDESYELDRWSLLNLIYRSKMNESRLAECFRALARRSRPELPPDFNSAVWSKIKSQEKRSTAAGSGRLKALLSVWAAPQWAVASLIVALAVGWGLGRITTGSPGSPADSRQVASVTGEVIDIACYFDDGATGPEHATCARACIASGLPVGLKTKNGKIYVLIGKLIPPSAEPGAKHESLNAQLAPLAAKIVTVTGTVVNKQNINVIENAELARGQARSEEPKGDPGELKAFLAHLL